MSDPGSRLPSAPDDRGLGNAAGAAPDASRAKLQVAMAAVGTIWLGLLYVTHGLAFSVPLDPRGAPGATAWLGLDRWAFVTAPWQISFLVLAVLVGLTVAYGRGFYHHLATAGQPIVTNVLFRLAAGGAAMVLFWFASSRVENLDGALLQQKLSEAAARSEIFMTLDEPLELYFHGRLWTSVTVHWGWDVTETYRVTSCLAGGAAVFMILGLARLLPPTRWPLVIAGMLTGGWILLFFGDVENYTLVNLAVLAYLIAALRFLEDDRRPLWPAGALLGLAALCHLEALVLAPSMLLLCSTAVRQQRWRVAIAGAAAGPALLALGLIWLSAQGLPLADLGQHSQITAQGGDWARFLAPIDGQYWWMQAQLLLLLAPCLVLVPALLTGDWHGWGSHARFLAVATAGAILMVGLWRAQLGAYEDWNLFALAAQPLSLLVFGGLAAQRRLGAVAPWLAAAVALMATHTAAWIAEHHAAVLS